MCELGLKRFYCRVCERLSMRGGLKLHDYCAPNNADYSPESLEVCQKHRYLAGEEDTHNIYGEMPEQQRGNRDRHLGMAQGTRSASRRQACPTQCVILRYDNSRRPLPISAASDQFGVVISVGRTPPLGKRQPCPIWPEILTARVIRPLRGATTL